LEGRIVLNIGGDITIKEALEIVNPVFIDLRSPHEFSRGSIPGSINIPLFNDEEREIIGLIYKKDRDKARMKGLSFIVPKLHDYVGKIKKIGQEKTPVLYCWRGGMRSKSVQALLESLEIPSYRLKGGYKSYRRFILDRLNSYKLNKPVYVLNGLTGTGKTEVLHLLQKKGCPVIDLEKLACHRGSLFGHLGITEQRCQKDFEALLWNHLEKHKSAPYLLIEGEGKRIGSVYQPEFLYKAIREGNHILLKAPLENRIARILKEYTPTSPEEIKKVENSILLLKKYLGSDTVEELLSLLKDEKYDELVSRLCSQYYDRLYSESRKEKNKYVSIVDSSNSAKAAEEIYDYLLKTIIEPAPAGKY
jgi:tRNA 2-selenouridine synthase